MYRMRSLPGNSNCSAMRRDPGPLAAFAHRVPDHQTTGKATARESVEATASLSRALSAGDHGKQDMDVLRASQGRVSVDRLRGMPRIHPSAQRAALGRTAKRP